jgi:hypothetical protein
MFLLRFPPISSDLLCLLILLGLVFVEEHKLWPWSVSDCTKQRNDPARSELLPAVLMKVQIFKRCSSLSTTKQRPWRFIAWVFRIRHWQTLPGLLDPADALLGSSGSGIAPLFLNCLTLKMHYLDLKDQALANSSWAAWPCRCTVWIFRIRHCPALPGLVDPEDALPGSSGSGIGKLFQNCLTLQMHCLDLQDQRVSHSSWTASPWRCIAWIFRVRHWQTLPAVLDPEDELHGSSGSGIGKLPGLLGPWRCTARIFRIRHWPTLPGLFDPEDAGITVFQTSVSSYSRYGVTSQKAWIFRWNYYFVYFDIYVFSY